MPIGAEMRRRRHVDLALARLSHVIEEEIAQHHPTDIAANLGECVAIPEDGEHREMSRFDNGDKGRDSTIPFEADSSRRWSVPRLEFLRSDLETETYHPSVVRSDVPDDSSLRHSGLQQVCVIWPNNGIPIAEQVIRNSLATNADDGGEVAEELLIGEVLEARLPE